MHRTRDPPFCRALSWSICTYNLATLICTKLCLPPVFPVGRFLEARFLEPQDVHVPLARVLLQPQNVDAVVLLQPNHVQVLLQPQNVEVIFLQADQGNMLLLWVNSILTSYDCTNVELHQIELWYHWGINCATMLNRKECWIVSLKFAADRSPVDGGLVGEPRPPPAGALRRNWRPRGGHERQGDREEGEERGQPGHRRLHRVDAMEAAGRLTKRRRVWVVIKVWVAF